MNNAHEIIETVCPRCGTVFKAPRYWHKKYCNAACSRSKKHERRMERANETLPYKSAEPAFDERFFVSITDPSELELTKYAELLTDGLTKGKPIQFLGTLPFWTAPAGISLTEQFGVEPRQWVMMKQEVNIMSMLK